jgi:hypothetical protein
MPEYEIVRADDPRCAELEAAGYQIVGESWAARLYEPDRELLTSDTIRAIWADYRVFGAVDGSELVGATTIREHEGTATPSSPRCWRRSADAASARR